MVWSCGGGACSLTLLPFAFADPLVPLASLPSQGADAHPACCILLLDTAGLSMVPSAACSRTTISLAFPIKIRSFLRSSRLVDAQIVGATCDSDVVAVYGSVVVPTLLV